MAKSENLVVKMILENKDFLKEIGVSQKQVQSFGSKMSNIMSVVGKAAGAIGIATTAYEALNKVMHSSQTLGDEYANTMYGLKGAVDSLFYSLGSGDFSSFLNGLDDIIRKGKEASAALDQLGNTRMSYNYFTSKNSAKFQDAITTLRDKNATPEQIAEAQAIVDSVLGSQSQLTDAFGQRINDALKALLTKDTILNTGDLSADIVDKILQVDVSANKDQLLGYYTKEYNDFRKSIKDLEKQGNTDVGYWDYTNDIRGVWTIDQDKYDSALAGIKAYYADAIVIYRSLQKENDEYLQQIISLSGEYDSASRNLSSWTKQANRATQSELGVTTGKPKENKEPDNPIGVINILNDKVSKLKESLASADDIWLARIFTAQIKEAEEELQNFQNMAAAVWEKGGEIADPSVTMPTGLENIIDQKGDVEDYTDSIGQMQQAMSSLFGALRGGEPTLKDFLGLFASLLGIFGGTYGAIAGTALSGLSGLIKANNAEPTAIVRGQDIYLALNNYNKSMM